MSAEYQGLRREETAFARSDAHRTTIRSGLSERLLGPLAVAELLVKAQTTQRAVASGWDMLASLQPAGEFCRLLCGFMGFGIILDDSLSTAVIGSEWPEVWYPVRSMQQLGVSAVFTAEAPTSISGSSPFAAASQGGTSADAPGYPEIRTHSRAVERLRGHERIIWEIGRIAAELSAHRGVGLIGIRVRPAWSHEYEDRTGIVLEVTLRASLEDRFAYWQALGHAVDALVASLPPEQSRFLDADVSLIVKRI